MAFYNFTVHGVNMLINVYYVDLFLRNYENGIELDFTLRRDWLVEYSQCIVEVIWPR